MSTKKIPEDQSGQIGSKNNKYVSLPYTLIRSEVWASLSLSSITAYINIRNNFSGFNDSDIKCPQNKLCRPMSPNVWHKAIGELKKKGLITIVRRTGGLYPNIYGLSNKWKDINRKMVALKKKSKVGLRDKS